jgi:hypothetical protein
MDATTRIAPNGSNHSISRIKSTQARFTTTPGDLVDARLAGVPLQHRPSSHLSNIAPGRPPRPSSVELSATPHAASTSTDTLLGSTLLLQLQNLVCR